MPPGFMNRGFVTVGVPAAVDVVFAGVVAVGFAAAGRAGASPEQAVVSAEMATRASVELEVMRRRMRRL
jgi:hypothetical protein